MQPLSAHYGTAVPLPRTSVDTDAIIPSEYCLTVKRTGFAEHLFASWRKDSTFALDEPERQAATVLVAGRDLGTGSSREHAVWALQDWGFRVVISSRFGDIFYNNCAKAGLVAARVDEPVVQELMAATVNDPTLRVTVDLQRRRVEWTGVDSVLRGGDIDMDDFTRRRFIEGLDDIDLTLTHEPLITAYESANGHRLPRFRTGASR
jgi:3-isopropylmalate/(R)-2-methylmalate dehydratase small subunit